MAQQTFKSMGKVEQIEYIDIPSDIRATYQYFTEANMHKLQNIGYNKNFYNLEDGIDDYVQNYLHRKQYF